MVVVVVEVICGSGFSALVILMAVSVIVVLRWRMRFSLPRVVLWLAHLVMAEARGSAVVVSVELCPSGVSAALGVAMQPRQWDALRRRLRLS